MDPGRRCKGICTKAAGYIRTFRIQRQIPFAVIGRDETGGHLIRTLVARPQILLLDEAFSPDYQTRLAVTEDIYSIIKKENKTAILVTHDISEGISMADRVIVLSKRPAAVKKIHEIRLSCEKRTPLRSREAPEFREYFNKIWKELDVNV